MADCCIVLLLGLKSPWQPAVGDKSESTSRESSLKAAALGNLCPRLLSPLMEKGLAKISLVSLRVPVFHG